MKKIFTNSKSSSLPGPPNEMINTAGYSVGQNYAHFIGKSFQLGQHTVYVEDVVAEGGFSIVFLVKSSLNGKKYALKRMYVNNDLDLEACKREIQIIKTLSEQNKKILKYIDSSIQRQSEDIYEILLLTKYCKLGGIVQLINERISNGTNRLHEQEILRIFCDVCEALVDCHSNGIIHRDLKIENILIDEVDSESSRRGSQQRTINYVLCDFGSATTQVYDRRSNQSLSVALVADEINRYTTLSYRSPEMVDLYSNKPITTKSDIWALGCLLYKLCYFQMPFGESQLAIQEGRFTLPDAKASFYSKQLNMLINYMLEPDPLKRPDIYHVSYLAFQLAQRPYPFKILDNIEMPSFTTLSMPLTESEWRRSNTSTSANITATTATATSNTTNSSAQQSSVQATSSSSSSGAAKSNKQIITPSETAVNPRERPKGNLTQTNSILPLSASNNLIKPRNQSVSASVNSNKLINVSIKPPQAPSHSTHAPVPPPPPPPPPPLPPSSHLIQHQQHQPTQIGFDDDFTILNTKPPISPPVHPTTHYDFDKQKQLPTANEKKSHRRSASHSSSNFLQTSASNSPAQQISFDSSKLNPALLPYTAPHLPPPPPQILIDNRISPSFILQQQQQQQYQAYLLQQQQQQQQLQQTSQPSNLNANRLFAPHHSRSASASPNVVTKINLASQIAEEAQKKMLTNQQVTNSSLNKPPGGGGGVTTNNPFGDSFSQLNDNDLFGMEFDWIRQKNSNNLATNQQQAMLDMSNKQMVSGAVSNEALAAKQESKLEKYNKKSKNQKDAQSSSIVTKIRHQHHQNNKMFQEISSASSSTSDLNQPSSISSPANDDSLTNANSSSSSDRSSTCVESLESKQHNSKSSQYSSSTTIVSVDSSAFKLDEPKSTTRSSKSNKSNKVLQSTRIHHHRTDDPFRNAPFRTQPVIDLNSSSSNSSTSSTDKLNKLIDDRLNLNDDTTNKNSSQPHVLQQSAAAPPPPPVLSAFQPYKRPPDPFVSAPFEHTPHKITSPTSSVTPTSTSIHSSSSKSTSKRKDNSALRKRSTTMNYRASNTTESPRVVSKKSTSIPNPFINAPFHATKKSKNPQSVHTSSSSQTIKASSNQHIQTSNSLNSFDESQSTPLASNYSSLDSNATPLAGGGGGYHYEVVPRVNELNLDNQQHLNKIPQSHSLNEILKQNEFNSYILSTNETNSIEPVIDTTKLQFIKHKRIPNESVNRSTNTSKLIQTDNSLHDTNNTNTSVKRIHITKSCSANATISEHSSKLVNKKSSTSGGGTSSAASGGGGIANMSFDDY